MTAAVASPSAPAAATGPAVTPRAPAISAAPTEPVVAVAAADRVSVHKGDSRRFADGRAFATAGVARVEVAVVAAPTVVAVSEVAAVAIVSEPVTAPVHAVSAVMAMTAVFAASKGFGRRICDRHSHDCEHCCRHDDFRDFGKHDRLPDFLGKGCFRWSQF